MYLSIRNNNGLCMLNLPDRDIVESSSKSNKLAGEKFTSEEQCRLVYGPDAMSCEYMVCMKTFVRGSSIIN